MNSHIQTQFKKILVISFHFPPSTLVGGKRFAFLSKIFHQKKYEVNVLTVNEKYISPKDSALKFGGIVHRTAMFPSFNPREKKLVKRTINSLWRRYFCVIDPFSGWILPALIKGLKLVKRKDIDIIIATGPPFTAMVIGFLIAKISSRRLILDYRDPWTAESGKVYDIFGIRVRRQLEKAVVKYASAVVFCSHVMKENFLERYSKIPRKICHVVTNGFYTRDDVRPLSIGEFAKNVIYAGNFYGERKIKLIANAISKAIEQGIITKENFCLHVFGKICSEDRATISEYGLQETVKEYSWVPYEKLIKFLKSADILFLISGSDVKYAIPFKFFDYLSVKRPILAVAPANSAVADIMHEIDCGRLAVINDEESIFSNLCGMLIEGNKHTYMGAEKFTWEQIARQYSGLIDEVANLRKHSAKQLDNVFAAQKN
jgi:glycosyltransferase involved in cell wall biosynthesis